MGRVKTRMEFITSDKKRKSVFESRSKCIKKKACELSTLCGVDVALFVINPTLSSDTNIETHVWPNNDNKADQQMRLHNLITRYKTHGSVKRKTKNVQRLLGNDETRQSELDSRYIQGMSEQELRKLATFLDSQIEKAKERIQYLKKGKQVIVNDDENKGCDVSSANQPQVVDIDSDDGADLKYLLDQILDNPETPNTDNLPLLDSAEDFSISWFDDLPPLVDLHDSGKDFGIPLPDDFQSPVDTATNSFSSDDLHYPTNMQPGHHQLNMKDPPMMPQYPSNCESLSYYLPAPEYYNASVFCQTLEPQIQTSSISNLSVNSSVWSMPFLP